MNIITCRVCKREAEAHEFVEDMCVSCGNTDWYALSNGLTCVMEDGTIIWGDEQSFTTEEN